MKQEDYQIKYSLTKFVPGMGTVITQSILVMDFPVVQAAVLLIAALVIVCNIASDILMAILDPRVREELK